LLQVKGLELLQDAAQVACIVITAQQHGCHCSVAVTSYKHANKLQSGQLAGTYE
jgi:hypothetical protein